MIIIRRFGVPAFGGEAAAAVALALAMTLVSVTSRSLFNSRHLVSKRKEKNSSLTTSKKPRTEEPSMAKPVSTPSTGTGNQGDGSSTEDLKRAGLVFATLIGSMILFGKFIAPDSSSSQSESNARKAQQSQEGIGGLVVLILVGAGALMAYSTLSKFLRSPDNFELLQRVGYSPSRHTRLASIGAKYGYSALSKTGKAASAGVASVSRSTPHWRPEFLANNKKLEDFTTPRKTRRRKLFYYEPGAAPIGMAALALGRHPGFKHLTKKGAEDESIDGFRDAEYRRESRQAEALARYHEALAEERKQNAPTGNVSVNVLVPPTQPQSSTSPATSTARLQNKLSDVSGSLSPSGRGIPGTFAIIGAAALVWIALIVPLGSYLTPMSLTFLEVSGAAMFGIAAYNTILENGSTLPLALTSAGLVGIMVFSASTAARPALGG